MNKRAFIDDVFEIIWAGAFIALLLIGFIGCQEVKQSNVEEGADGLIIEMESHEYLREFLRLNHELIFNEDYDKLQISARKFFNNTASPGVMWKLSFAQVGKRTINIDEKDSYVCDDNKVVSSIKFPVKDYVMDISLFRRMGCVASQTHVRIVK